MVISAAKLEDDLMTLYVPMACICNRKACGHVLGALKVFQGGLHSGCGGLSLEDGVVLWHAEVVQMLWRRCICRGAVLLAEGHCSAETAPPIAPPDQAEEESKGEEYNGYQSLGFQGSAGLLQAFTILCSFGGDRLGTVEIVQTIPGPLLMHRPLFSV